MILWDDLLIRSRGIPIPLYRKPEISQAYHENRIKVCADYEHYSDMILVNHLRWKRMGKSSQRTRGSLSVRLEPNHFPYDLEPGIAHLVLWSVIPLSEGQMHRKIKDQLKRMYKSEVEYIAFVNFVEDQTIRDLWHAHVFARPQGSNFF